MFFPVSLWNGKPVGDGITWHNTPDMTEPKYKFPDKSNTSKTVVGRNQDSSFLGHNHVRSDESVSGNF